MTDFKDFEISDYTAKLIDSQIYENNKFEVDFTFNELDIFISGSGSFKTFKDETGDFDGEIDYFNIEIDVYEDGDKIDTPEELEKYIHSQLPRL